jgi:hypothetical protein
VLLFNLFLSPQKNKIYTIHPNGDPNVISQGIRSPLILEGVNFDKVFVKWGNLNEKLLNGVISVKNVKVEDKKWNLL